jgi:SAM-dependent methyltransferase
MGKQYDKEYFERWYHNRETRVNTDIEVRRKVSVAVAIAEYFLRRQIRTVLDVGCGEGAWRAHLKTMRPRVEYMGLDSSDYVVETFGKARNIRKATFGELPRLKLDVYDLVVCSDVMHYVPDDELQPGIKTLANVTDGLAFLEVLAKEDDVVGDLDAFIKRPAVFYRRLFRTAGMTPVGPYCWLSPAFENAVAALEHT